MGLARQIRRLQKRREEVAFRKQRRKAIIEPLEPRLLLSADLSYTMGGTVKDLTLDVNQIDGVDMVQLIKNDDPDPGTQIVVSQALSEDAQRAPHVTGVGASSVHRQLSLDDHPLEERIESII